MRRYEQYVLLIIAFTVLIISVFHIVTAVLNMTRTEGFDLYEEINKINDDAKLAIEQSRYQRPLLSNQDTNVKDYEQLRIDAEKKEYGERDINCVWNWNEASICEDKVCDKQTGNANGKIRQSFTIVTQSQKAGKPCPEENTTKDTDCSVPCDVDCELEADPYDGQQTCDALSRCDGNSPSASGFKNLKYKIKVQPRNGGKRCSSLKPNLTCPPTELAGETCILRDTCNTSSCKVNCVRQFLRDKNHTATCTVDEPNAAGSMTREYSVARHKANDGADCVLEENLPWNKTDCPVFDKYANGFPKYKSFAIKLKGSDYCVNWYGGGNAPGEKGNMVMKNICNNSDQVRFRAWPDGQLQVVSGGKCIKEVDGNVLYMDGCDDDYRKFTFDKNTGKIMNKATSKYIEANAGWDAFAKYGDGGSSFELYNAQDDDYLKPK